MTGMSGFQPGVAEAGHPLPPGPTRWPVARSMHWFKDPVGFIGRWQARYGPVFRAPLGPKRNTVFVADPELVRGIVTADASTVRTGDGNGLMRPVLGPSSLLVIDGEEHRQHRALIRPAFHGSVMRKFTDLVAAVTAERVADWPRGRPFELHEEMREITFSTILRIVLGRMSADRERRLRELFPRVMDLCSSPLTLTPYFRRRVGGISPYGRLMRAVEELDELLHAEIRDRLTDPGVATREDALAMLIRTRDSRDASLTDSELRDELMTMLVAGHETTAAALSWAFERLARHPQIAARIATDPEDDVYLEAVVREVLRQRPLVPALVRKLTVPALLGEYALPEGWVLMPAVFSVHHDPRIYPEPERFSPERFLGPDPPPAWAWIPFGGGNRRCVGASLALLEMRVVLRSVLSRVELSPLRPESERVRRRRFTLAPEDDATVVVADRRRQPAPSRRLPPERRAWPAPSRPRTAAGG